MKINKDENQIPISKPAKTWQISHSQPQTTTSQQYPFNNIVPSVIFHNLITSYSSSQVSHRLGMRTMKARLALDYGFSNR